MQHSLPSMFEPNLLAYSIVYNLFLTRLKRCEFSQRYTVQNFPWLNAVLDGAVYSFALIRTALSQSHCPGLR